MLGVKAVRRVSPAILSRAGQTGAHACTLALRLGPSWPQDVCLVGPLAACARRPLARQSHFVTGDNKGLLSSPRAHRSGPGLF